MQGYCLKCHKKRAISHPKAVAMKNAKPATQGTCPKCGTKMFRIGKSSGKLPPPGPEFNIKKHHQTPNKP